MCFPSTETNQENGSVVIYFTVRILCHHGLDKIIIFIIFIILYIHILYTNIFINICYVNQNMEVLSGATPRHAVSQNIITTTDLVN